MQAQSLRVRTLIRPATAQDLAAMWAIFHAVAARGDALPFDERFPRADFEAQWGAAGSAWVAQTDASEPDASGVDASVVGMYRSATNHAGRGAHVASATYLVAPEAQGRGIGRALVAHSLARARQAGFAAMQFNYVVSSNTAAVALYRKFGFRVVGVLPRAFRHAQLGNIDAWVMYRELDDIP